VARFLVNVKDTGITVRCLAFCAGKRAGPPAILGETINTQKMLKVFWPCSGLFWHDVGLQSGRNKLYFMKKLLMIGIVVLACLSIGTVAVAQPPHAKAWGKKAKHNWKRGQYYYYPSANVYYNPVAHRYWYPRNGVWVNTGALPRSVIVYKQPAYVVYREMDDDIWRDNRGHYSRYYRPVPVRPGVTVDVHARF
jgi:hypothetical protein